MNKNQKAIQCHQCKLWSHASCNGITKSEYELISISIDVIHTQLTKSSHGSIAMYLKKTLDYTIRDDLSVVSDEYETLWVEINTGSKAKSIPTPKH